MIPTPPKLERVRLNYDHLRKYQMQHPVHSCPVCDNVEIAGDRSWQLHLSSRLHKLRQQRVNQAKRAAALAAKEAEAEEEE